MKTTAAGLSDVGRRRKGNEDSYHIDLERARLIQSTLAATAAPDRDR